MGKVFPVLLARSILKTRVLHGVKTSIFEALRTSGIHIPTWDRCYSTFFSAIQIGRKSA